jgi:hypothetical protein
MEDGMRRALAVLGVVAGGCASTPSAGAGAPDPVPSELAIEVEGSNLPDPEVVHCVLKTFYDLKFPAPSGIVTVIYPIMLSPG